MSVVFGRATPILRVADLEASIAYYIDKLGFKVDWKVTMMASVSREHAGIMLCEGAQGNPGTWVWVGVDDAAALHEEYVAKGAKIRRAPSNFEWAYEMQVEDLDGHVLRLGSDTLKDKPIEK